MKNDKEIFKFKFKLNQNEIGKNLAQKFIMDNNLKGIYNIVCSWNYKYENDKIIVDFCEIELTKTKVDI
jgi:hypothetical protein